MALNGGQLGKLILAQCASKGLVGVKMNPLSKALGEGIVSSFKEMNQVQTIDVGVLTVGTGKGKMTGILPNTLTGVVIPLQMAQGILGTEMKAFTEGVCFAVATHFNTMNEVETTHSTVALGSGTGKVLGLTPNKMENKIMQNLKAQNLKGSKMASFIKAFSTGFCMNIMATAIINVAITGSPAPLILGAPVPSVGSGTGKVK